MADNTATNLHTQNDPICETSGLLTRCAASDYLRSHGYPVAIATLATLVTRGGGPQFQKFGTRVLYNDRDLLVWARAKLSPPMTSSSQDMRHRRTSDVDGGPV
jgi:hypothetical protein